ncbi:MAG: PQQ-dependent sugar dehydrogenase [Phycisphaerales bacterium]
MSLSGAAHRFSGLVIATMTVAVAATALADVPPATPVVTEPQLNRIVNPGDVHMECEAFMDADPGDTHVCTDWEIWTVSPSARVWSTLCIGGVERVHTHLGDGTFEGSHAGRTTLLDGTQYRLRVRHRDSGGNPSTEWSAFGERLFTTGQASVLFPLEADDVVAAPVPTWRTSIGAAITLPVAATAPSLRVESGTGGLLLQFSPDALGAMTINNPGALPVHGPVRVRVSAGSLSEPLALPESQITCTMGSGAAVTIYLPALNVNAGMDAFFWVQSGGSTYVGQSAQTSPDFTTLARGTPVPWAARQSGYRVEVVATGFQLPVNIAFVPNPSPAADAPLYYVTELYGTIKVVLRNGVVQDYATNLLNFNPTGNFPGSGEQGVAGVVVDPVNGDLIATMLYSSQPGVEAAPHYPRVVRFTSNNGGRTAATQTTILNMVGESQGQSHQISNITFGPDDKLYVHVGDGFDAATAQNLSSFRGKILRINRNGTPVTDNPFYDAANGLTARDYVFAYGFRNPFGGDWRQSDGQHYEVENGPSVDRICQVISGRNYLWNGSDASMANFAIYNWNPAVGPVNMAFIQPGTFGGSGYPASKQDHLFISESGPTWATGPQTNGKRISEFVLDAAGNRVSGPTPLIEYVGSGKASVVALAAGPDGLYFSDFYKDLNFQSPIDRGSNILRVRFVGAADFTASVTSGDAPLNVQFTDTSTVPGPTEWHWDFGDGTQSTLQSPAHTYTADGIYAVTLTVTGSTGVSIETKPAFIRVGEVPSIALIGGSASPSASDASVQAHLAALGYDVQYYDDEPGNRPSAAALAAEHSLVIASSTIASGNIGGEFRTADVPLIFWENALLRPGRESLTDNGAVVSATTLDIINTVHPITSGLSLGDVPAFTSASNMSVALGALGSGATVLARRSGSTDGAIVVANAGATVTGGYVTPARRVFLYFEDASWSNATPASRGILERSVCWAMNVAAPIILEQPQGDSACIGESVMLSTLAQGTPPLSYQWRRNGTPIPGANARTLTVAAGPATVGAYDVVVSNTCFSTTTAAVELTTCPADFNCDGELNPDDLGDYINCFFAAPPCDQADFNHDGNVDPDDLGDFINAYFSNCP